MNHTGKCPSQVPCLECWLPLPARHWGPLHSPCRLASSGRGSVHHVSWRKPYLKEGMTLFSMQRTMKALWQLAAFCSNSLPVSIEEAWPVAAVASVRHVSQ